jgi:hypothetical protein
MDPDPTPFFSDFMDAKNYFISGLALKNPPKKTHPKNPPKKTH